MSVHCDVILKWGATPDQLKALGNALWSWCIRAAGDSAVYQYLDNQALADLIAGQFPASSPTPWPGGLPSVHVSVRDAAFVEHHAAIESLRRKLPAAGIERIVVDGTSWKPADSPDHLCLVP